MSFAPWALLFAGLKFPDRNPGFKRFAFLLHNKIAVKIERRRLPDVARRSADLNPTLTTGPTIQKKIRRARSQVI